MGSECLRLVLDDPFFQRVVVLTRRPLPERARAPKLEQHVVDFGRLDQHATLLEADQLICAIGTTMKQAGSREAFRAVDYDLALSVARRGAERGVRHLLLVSSLGADGRSRFFYNQVKGELEEAVFALPFRSVSVFRPSVLLGDRAEFRLGEEVARRLAFLAPAVPARYRPIHGRVVAAAVVRVAKEDLPGRRIVESAEMRAWAAGGS